MAEAAERNTFLYLNTVVDQPLGEAFVDIDFSST